YSWIINKLCTVYLHSLVILNLCQVSTYKLSIRYPFLEIHSQYYFLLSFRGMKQLGFHQDYALESLEKFVPGGWVLNES
ncbi:hypothetical protein, partial [Roseofilum sp. Belize Diploria]|uniref:hypothetical protein n=1 Tax=Roseofilum sp. Belize Diploria TaxID=2821501 RepID=UPI001B234AD8